MTLAVDKMDGHGHINTARRERLPKKTKVTQYYVATKGRSERHSTSFLKVRVGKCVATHLKEGQPLASQ